MRNFLLPALTVAGCLALAACGSEPAPAAPTAQPHSTTIDAQTQVKEDALTALTLLDPITRSQHLRPGSVAHRDAAKYVSAAMIKKFYDSGQRQLKLGFITTTDGMEKSLIAVESVTGDQSVVHSCAVGQKVRHLDRQGNDVPQPKQTGPQPPFRTTMQFKRVADVWQMQTYTLDRSKTCTAA